MARSRWNTKLAIEKARAAAAEGLLDAAEHVLEESNRRVPHDEGVLQDSGATDVDTRALVATVSYDTPYAVKQHEDLTLRHPNGREAKYLENALKERRQSALELLAKRLREALR